jgi:hypothetical protein
VAWAPGQGGGRGRGAPRALPSVRALPAQQRQPACLHRRYALLGWVGLGARLDRLIPTVTQATNQIENN